MSSLIPIGLLYQILNVLFQFITSTMRNDKRDGSVKTNAYSYSTIDNSWFHIESRIRGDAPLRQQTSLTVCLRHGCLALEPSHKDGWTAVFAAVYAELPQISVHPICLQLQDLAARCRSCTRVLVVASLSGCICIHDREPCSTARSSTCYSLLATTSGFPYEPV